MKSKILTSDKHYKMSYLILYAGIFLGIAIIYQQLSNSVEYAIVAFDKNATYSFLTLFKNLTITLILGFSWFFLTYMIRFIVINLLMVGANDIEEMEKNNYLYFILSSIIFISLLFLFQSTLESIGLNLTDRVSSSIFN